MKLGLLGDLFAKMIFLCGADVSRQASQNTRVPIFQCLGSQRDAGLADIPESILLLGVKAIKKNGFGFLLLVFGGGGGGFYCFVLFLEMVKT